MRTDNESVKQNYELRADARNQLKGNWGKVILLCFLYTLICSLPNIVDSILEPNSAEPSLPLLILFIIISLMVAGPLLLGFTSSILKFIRGESFTMKNLFDGFGNFLKAILLTVVQGIFIFLWSLLLFIPGIIAGYRYSMSYYILSDDPSIGVMEAIKKSKQMMIGYKWKLFCLHISFIGWGLLCILTLGIGFLWLIPYIKISEANFYENLKNSYTTSLDQP